MFKTIPFFYADLIARMIPGAVFLALLQLTTLKPPSGWVELRKIEGAAVFIPLLYLGLTYLLGTILEAGLSHFLERFYIWEFTRACRNHAWLQCVTRDQTQGATKDETQCDLAYLSRATFGYFIVASEESENQVVSHLVRFHSEAKMCFSILFLLFAFLLLNIICMFFDCVILRAIDEKEVWFGFQLLGIIILLYTTHQRLSGRARFILRAVDRFSSEKRSLVITRLHDQLQSCGATQAKSS